MLWSTKGLPLPGEWLIIRFARVFALQKILPGAVLMALGVSVAFG
jgi:hypothetical protein